MTVRDCLLAWKFVVKHESMLTTVMFHGQTECYVHLLPEGQRVTVVGRNFLGCRTVGDLRKLLHLLDRDVFLDGDKIYDKSRMTDAESAAYYQGQIRWGRADCLPLKLDGQDSE